MPELADHRSPAAESAAHFIRNCYLCVKSLHKSNLKTISVTLIDKNTNVHATLINIQPAKKKNIPNTNSIYCVIPLVRSEGDADVS